MSAYRTASRDDDELGAHLATIDVPRSKRPLIRAAMCAVVAAIAAVRAYTILETGTIAQFLVAVALCALSIVGVFVFVVAELYLLAEAIEAARGGG